MRLGGSSLIPFSEGERLGMLVWRSGPEILVRKIMKSFLHTVDTLKSFKDAVEAVEVKVAESTFRVVNTYDVAATLTEQGYPRSPLKIIEVCNARYASEALEKDINVALMLPCPIAVYTEGGKTFIGTMRPSALVALCPASGLEQIAAEVERVVVQIVDDAARAGSLPSDRESAIVVG
jgi:uncharacterized protein (DUF302 family)